MKSKLSIIVILCVLIIIAVMATTKFGHQNDKHPSQTEETTYGLETSSLDTTTYENTTKEESKDRIEVTTRKPDKPAIDVKADIDDVLNKNESDYFIYIELGGGTITVYGKSQGGKYDEVIKRSPVSVGLNDSTPTGIFCIEDRKEWLEEPGEGFSRFATILDHSITITSALYETTDGNTLIRKSYRSLGQPATDGTIRTTADTAYWIMYNCINNTPVQIVEGNPKNIVCEPLPDLNPDYTFTDPTDPLYKTPDMLESENELPYRIYVEKGSFTMTVYGLDENHEFTVPVRTLNTAVGRTAGRTPVGTFAVYKKERWHQFAYNGGYAQYATSYYGNLFIHSPIYSLQEIDTMFSEFYNEIGTASTAGCLRTTSYASYWIYAYCPMGTQVVIVNGSPKGTVSEKPPKINNDYLTIDPTDPFNPDSVY